MPNKSVSVSQRVENSKIEIDNKKRKLMSILIRVEMEKLIVESGQLSSADAEAKWKKENAAQHQPIQ